MSHDGSIEHTGLVAEIQAGASNEPIKVKSETIKPDR